MTTINSINTAYPIGAANGGTGLTSITAHGIMVGEGTSSVATKVLTNGQLLIGSTGVDPVAASITSTGSTLTVTGGAGTINIDITAPVTVANGGTGAITLTNHGILLGAGTSAITATTLTNGQLLIGSTGAAPSAATITAGAGISVTNGAGTITVAATTTGTTWNDTTGTSATLAASNSYVADNAGLVTYTLPATAAFGDEYEITAKAAGGWTVAQNALQSIVFGTISTTVGVGGSLSSTQTGDTIRLVCITANTTWQVLSSIGNITYV